MTWTYAYRNNKNSIAFINHNGDNLFKIVIDCNQLQSIKIIFTHQVYRAYRKTKEDYERVAREHFASLSKKLARFKVNQDNGQNIDLESLSKKLSEAKLKVVWSRVFLIFENTIIADEFNKLLIAANINKITNYDDIMKRDHCLRISDSIYDIIQQDPHAFLNLRCSQDSEFVQNLEQAAKEYTPLSIKNDNFLNFFKNENFIFKDLECDGVPGEYFITLSNAKDLERLFFLLTKWEDIIDLKETIFSSFDFESIMERINSYDENKIDAGKIAKLKTDFFKAKHDSDNNNNVVSIIPYMKKEF